MNEFPTKREDYNLWVYSCNEGLVTLLCITVNPNDGQETLAYMNQNEQIFTRPLSEFTSQNFTPQFKTEVISRIDKNVTTITGMSMFGSTFKTNP